MPYALQSLHMLVSLILILSFAMLRERRMSQLIHLYAWQGAVLVLCIWMVAHLSHQQDLYLSALITLLSKVFLLPWVLFRLLSRLGLHQDREALVNMPTIMLIGIALVILAFDLARPLQTLTLSIAGRSLGIALACVLLSLLMMIVRTRAMAQVIAFLALENALIFAATFSTNGMPMLIELGMALDLLMGMLVLAVFLLHVRAQAVNLDSREVGQWRGGRS